MFKRPPASDPNRQRPAIRIPSLLPVTDHIPVRARAETEVTEMTRPMILSWLLFFQPKLASHHHPVRPPPVPKTSYRASIHEPVLPLKKQKLQPHRQWTTGHACPRNLVRCRSACALAFRKPMAHRDAEGRKTEDWSYAPEQRVLSLRCVVLVESSVPPEVGSASTLFRSCRSTPWAASSNPMTSVC